MSKDTPIIINNRDRVTSLCRLISWLLEAGHTNITVLDNDSSYPPLLEYYETLDGLVTVAPLAKNLGSKAVWVWSESTKCVKSPFVYTDSDIVPTEECPKDLIDFLIRVSERFGSPNKVGVGLKIDDLPDCYAKKDWVCQWESQYWDKKVGEMDGVPIYSAFVDTTFALYPEFKLFSLHGIRTGPPYTARHVPWYVDSANPSEEDLYYERHASRSFHNWGINECHSKAVRNKCER
jgi:hypothetical protein